MVIRRLREGGMYTEVEGWGFELEVFLFGLVLV